MNYKNKTCCVVDNGLFLEVAIKLAKDFKTVYYYSPWEGGYPKSNAFLVGNGIPEIRRVKAIWPLLDVVDLWVFPDVYQGALQVHLDNLGKRVFGGRMGEELELDRAASKKHCAKLGIDIGPWRVIVGTDKLREWLKTHANQYVKVSTLRGDFETFCSPNYALVEPKLDELESSLGPRKKIIEFIVEDAIENAVEIGFDGIVIDGKVAPSATIGIEVKDKSFLMKTTAYSEIPQEIREVNTKLESTFKAYKYRGFFSSELRITRDKKAFLIDPCARAGSPPTELFLEIVTNWADIFWNGAEGIIVDPAFKGRWGAELMIQSAWADKNWQAVQFPQKLRDNVKLRNLTIIEGKYYVAPQWVGVSDIGAVVATGNSADEAIQKCKEYAEEIQGYFIEVPKEALDEAKDEWTKLQSFGVKV